MSGFANAEDLSSSYTHGVEAQEAASQGTNVRSPHCGEILLTLRRTQMRRHVLWRMLAQNSSLSCDDDL